MQRQIKFLFLHEQKIESFPGSIMLAKFKIPKTIIWVVNLFLLFLLIFTLFRFATYFAFKPYELDFFDLLPSFFLGIQFDLRWIAIILLPLVMLSFVPSLSPFYSAKNMKWWTWYLAIITFVIFFFFAADFGNFSYNRTRLNASALNFVEDAGISMSMLWQSYPILWLLLGLVIAVLFFRWMYRRIHGSVISKTEGLGIPHRRRWFIAVALLLGFMVYGGLNVSGLKWNRAFVLNDNFKSYLALNPLQNFFTTLKFRKPQYNENKAREYFSQMAEWIPLPDQNEFNYRREVFPERKGLESQPNVVLVLCESFSVYKSSLSGNPLNTTPYFQQLASAGIYFEKCFTPHFSTARGLFSLITGIPDVQLSKFSTRNPLALDQHTIINNFDGYEKMYLIGGSPEFNNFQGLLSNINDLKTYSEKDFSAPKMNVWGISDKNLFLEANALFRKKTSPFFAIIQTANNHRPFMIPEEDSDFERISVDRDSLKKYGFESVEELNSFRYSDYCFKKFMEAAEKENYFHNTIFVFVGDHGVSGNASAFYPEAWTEQRLTDEHVPLLFYAPYLLMPQHRAEVVSQIDVLPTIAGMLQQPYLNTTLGRDLLDPKKKNNYAFIIHHDEGRIGIVTDEYYYLRNINFPEEFLLPVKPGVSSFSKNYRDSIMPKMGKITCAIYETSKWMLMNNK